MPAAPSASSAATVAFVTHPDCLKHDMGAHHPERPERLAAIAGTVFERARRLHIEERVSVPRL